MNVVRRVLVLLIAAGALASCTDEEIVFRDRPIFEDPATAANGFLGYADAEGTNPELAGLTVCGQCHIGMQSGWETTGHAGAWETLEASGHAQDFCRECHSVTERGNFTEADGGWAGTGQARYYDVQCESCHGPGLDHVTDPDATQPLAAMSVGLDLETGCGECHQGAHQPFVEQWADSDHGLMPNSAYPAGRGDYCSNCHEGKAALSQKMGEDTDFLEQDEAGNLAITCGVCHDPHGSPNSANLRRTISEPSTEHLCVTCHSNRGTPWSTHGPHAPQGLLVLGENVGYFADGFTYDTTSIVSTHGTEANPKLCATCHVPSFEVTDPETGDFVFQSVGHLFEATPCIDPDTGLPVRGPCDDSQEDFAACATSGCHGTPDAARSAFIAVKTRMNNLLDEAWVDVNGNHVMDPYPEDTGLLPQVLNTAPGDLDVTSSTLTPAKGLVWNALLTYTRDRLYWGDFEVGGNHMSGQKGSGDGVHNPFLLEALMLASIEEVENEYGITASPGLSRSRALEVPPGWTQR